MSLVNDMLRDLEKRKAAETESSINPSVSRESMIEPKQSAVKKKDIVLLLLLVAVVALLGYIFLVDEKQEPSVQVDVKTVPDSMPENKTLILDEPELASAETVESTKEPLEKSSTVSEPTKAEAIAKAETRKTEKKVHEKAVSRDKPRTEKKNIKTQETPVAKQKVGKPKEELAEQKVVEKKSIEQEQSSKDSSLKVVLSPSALDLKTASDAISLFEVGKPNEAYALMQGFVAENTTVEKTLSVLANRLLQDQRFDELSDLLLSSGKPLGPGLRQVQARWLLMQGNPEAAIALLEQARPSIETIPEYYALLASLYQRNSQAGKAFEQYSELIQSNDTVADWWAGLGIASDQMKQQRQAVFAYQQALSLPGLNGALEQYIKQRLQALPALK